MLVCLSLVLCVAYSQTDPSPPSASSLMLVHRRWWKEITANLSVWPFCILSLSSLPSAFSPFYHLFFSPLQGHISQIYLQSALSGFTVTNSYFLPFSFWFSIILLLPCSWVSLLQLTCILYFLPGHADMRAEYIACAAWSAMPHADNKTRTSCQCCPFCVDTPAQSSDWLTAAQHRMKMWNNGTLQFSVLLALRHCAQ